MILFSFLVVFSCSFVKRRQGCWIINIEVLLILDLPYSLVMSEELKALRDIIANSINSILDICESSGQDFPCLSKPVDDSEFTPDGIRNDPVVSNSISTAVSASFQLIATLQSPPTTLATMAFRVCRTFN